MEYGAARRPRPIGAEESDNLLDGDGGSDRDGEGQAILRSDGESQGVETGRTPEETKTGTTKRKPAFSENDLVKRKGLLKVYEQFPKKCRYQGRGREAQFLRGLMIAYKEWGYELFPSLAFEDLARRTESLGGKERTRDLMRMLRDRERERAMEVKHGRSAMEEMRAREAAMTAQEENPTEDGDTNDGELASNRYVEVNPERASVSSARGNVKASRVLSPEIRERMEANRRQALEKLRVRKEEMAKRAEESINSAMGTPADINERRKIMGADVILHEIESDPVSAAFHPDLGSMQGEDGSRVDSTVTTGVVPPSASSIPSQSISSSTSSTEDDAADVDARANAPTGTSRASVEPSRLSEPRLNPEEDGVRTAQQVDSSPLAMTEAGHELVATSTKSSSDTPTAVRVSAATKETISGRVHVSENLDT